MLYPFPDRVVVFLRRERYANLAWDRYYAPLTITFQGAAAAAVWQFVNDNRCIKYEDKLYGILDLGENGYPAPLDGHVRYQEPLCGLDGSMVNPNGAPMLGKPCWGIIPAPLLPGLRSKLQRLDRLFSLLRMSAHSASKSKVQQPVEILAYALTTERHLNDEIEGGLENRVEFEGDLRPALRRNRTAMLDRIGSHVFEDKVEVARVNATHFRPLTFAGILVDLGAPDPQSPLPVLLSFDDTRLAGSRYNLEMSSHCTMQACMTYATDRLQLARACEPWILAKGKPEAKDSKRLFVSLADLIGGLVYAVGGASHAA